MRCRKAFSRRPSCFCRGIEPPGTAGRPAGTHRPAGAFLSDGAGLRDAFQLYGEDQILGQIKEAAVLSRELNCMNAELETAFRLAVTGAKRVKTQIRLCPTRPSAATAAIEKLRQTYGPLRGIPCLILGGGTMARLTAKALLADRLRGHHGPPLHPGEHGPAPALPPGVSTLAYEDRYPALSRFPIVCSATASPHLTIRWEQARPYLGKTFQTFVDLAVPRDIDPALHQCSRDPSVGYRRPAFRKRASFPPQHPGGQTDSAGL